MFSLKDRAFYGKYFHIEIEQCGCLSYNFINSHNITVYPTNADDYKCSKHCTYVHTINLDKEYLTSSIREILNLNGSNTEEPFPTEKFVDDFIKAYSQRFDIFGSFTNTLAIIHLPFHYHYRPIDFINFMNKIKEIIKYDVCITVTNFSMHVEKSKSLVYTKN